MRAAFKLWSALAVGLALLAAALRAQSVAPELPALKAKPGHIIGRAVDARGEPLSNVTLFIGSPTFVDGREASYNVELANGEYDLEVSDGFYYVYATVSIDYNGLTYNIGLHPIDGKHRLSKSNSKNGIVKDFFWKLRGMNTSGLDPNSGGRLGSALDIPIGVYTVTAQLTLPGGQTQQIRIYVQPNRGETDPAPSATLEFAPESSLSTGGIKQTLLYLLY